MILGTLVYIMSLISFLQNFWLIDYVLVLPKLISLLQNAFVPYRDIHDNFLISMNFFLCLIKRRKKIGYMVIRVDLEKAYNLQNGILLGSVFRICFSIGQIGYDNVSPLQPFKVIVNGKIGSNFVPESGIGQDWLSPYIFIICKDIDCLNMNFFWKHNVTHSNKSRLYALAQDKACRPKSQGGLGIENPQILMPHFS